MDERIKLGLQIIGLLVAGIVGYAVASKQIENLSARVVQQTIELGRLQERTETLSKQTETLSKQTETLSKQKDAVEVALHALQQQVEPLRLIIQDLNRLPLHEILSTIQSHKTAFELLARLDSFDRSFDLVGSRLEVKRLIVLREGIKILDDGGLKIYDDNSPSYFVIAPQGATVLKSFVRDNEESVVYIPKLRQ